MNFEYAQKRHNRTLKRITQLMKTNQEVKLMATSKKRKNVDKLLKVGNGVAVYTLRPNNSVELELLFPRSFNLWADIEVNPSADTEWVKELRADNETTVKQARALIVLLEDFISEVEGFQC